LKVFGAVSVEEGEGDQGMRAIELIFTFIIIVGIIYTAIPCALSVYCFVILPQMHNNDVFGVDKAAVNEVIIDHYQPVPEYVNTSHQPKTIAQLQTALDVCNPPQPCSQSYDCSNLAAYTEHYLENNGFDTTISASFTEGHAWCSVYNIANYTEVHIECIPPAHIIQRHPPIELSYNNITEALAGEYPYEFFWWCF
jgi:hypothetical protein